MAKFGGPSGKPGGLSTSRYPQRPDIALSVLDSGENVVGPEHRAEREAALAAQQFSLPHKKYFLVMVRWRSDSVWALLWASPSAA
jgi:hypothetical protein